MTELKQADEPVARVTGYYSGYPVIEPLNRAMVMTMNMALYTHPQPKRKWVGLSKEEVDELDCVKVMWPDYDSCEVYGVEEFARAIEAKLKEKNHV